MRLALGTVQFGRDYGVTNTGGQVAEEEVARILERASVAGVDMLDTAPGYGEAEAVLGRALVGTDRHAAFRIVTKTAVLRDMARGRPAADAVRETFEGSLTRLGRDAVYGLIVHLAEDLLGADGDSVWQAMEDIRAAGAVAKIGASCYTPAELTALDERYPLELVQVPFNVFDQRMLVDDGLAGIKANGIEIHVRSVFLQGLAFMRPEALPPGFSRAAPGLAAFREAAARADLGPAAMALAFVQSRPEVDRAVVGVTSLRELEELLEAARAAPPADLDFASLAIADEAVVTPSLWPPDGDETWHFTYHTDDDG